MCFVGDNNSGKSYLMSLLWGILALGKDIFPKSPSDSKMYRRCESCLKEYKNQNIEITKEIVEMYIQWFNEMLDIHKKDLLLKIFNYEVEEEKISISNYKRKKKLEI